MQTATNDSTTYTYTWNNGKLTSYFILNLQGDVVALYAFPDKARQCCQVSYPHYE